MAGFAFMRMVSAVCKMETNQCSSESIHLQQATQPVFIRIDVSATSYRAVSGAAMLK